MQRTLLFGVVCPLIPGAPGCSWFIGEFLRVYSFLVAVPVMDGAAVAHQVPVEHVWVFGNCQHAVL